MKRLYASESLADVGHLKNLLEQVGIDCIVRNEQLCGALGEIPFLECLPELWVLRDDDLPHALQLLERHQDQEPVSHAPWQCADCGNANEGQFAACWSCGALDSGV